MSSKKYYRDINLIRIICAIAILFYHLGILKGGYLAVCTFFVLSGYFSCISAFKKEKFSVISYYKDRLKRVYLPLLMVVFISIAVLSFFDNIYWFNLKPETTSVLFGYNNFWQKNANLDYFARHVDSPFMHLWYISILMQFELIFPFLFKIFKKIGDQKKFIPCAFLTILSIISGIYFYKLNITKGINFVYYDTLARIFSILFGLTIGFIHSYYDKLIIKNKIFSRIIFYVYFLMLISMFIFIPSSSKYYSLAMIISTIISARLIDYGTVNISLKQFVPNITYEVYLFQYPLIFMFEYINISYKIPLIILITIILAYILHFCLNSKKYKFLRIMLLIIMVSFYSYGVYKYSISKDYTKEMQELKEQLADNEKKLNENNKKYMENLKKEEDDWAKEFDNLENYEEKLKEVVKSLPIVGIGDSVMLGAVNNLYNIFPNGYFDAKISRSMWVAINILENLQKNEKLGYPIVIHLGTNGDCSASCKDQIMNIIGDKDVYLINTTNLDSVNISLKNYAEKHDNIYLIDWKSISNGHKEYFYADGIHLTPIGRKAYSEVIYNAIYNNYLKEYEIKKNDLIKGYEEKQRNKISFYGNQILLGAFDDIKNDFSDSNFVINDYENIKKLLSENKITKRIVFIFNDLSSTMYDDLIKLCNGSDIYIVNINKSISSVEGANIIDFDIKKDYLMPDGKHLNDKGNKELSRILMENIK